MNARSTPSQETPETPDDPYRSRDRAVWEAGERVDPVIRPGQPGPLSTEQLEQFERDGFIALSGWLDEAEVEAALADAESLARQRRGTEEVVCEPDSDVVRSVFRVHEGGSVIPGLARMQRLAGVARQILGSDVYIHQSRVNYKPPLDGREFFWHSDFETWHIEDGMPRMRAVSASISLNGSNEFNGPLMLIPGSHRTYVRTVGETPDEHYKTSLRRQEIGVPNREALTQLVEAGGIQAPKGPPGSVVFFDCNTMHGSVGNLSPFPRTNLFFVFNSMENPLVDPFGGKPPRPAHIANRDPEPLAVGS